jgi:hypothetical protein
MKHDPFDRLFSSDLSDDTVDRLFTFLSQLTDTFFEAYHDQLTRMAQQEAHDRLQPPEDIDDSDFDDEIPM